MHNVRVIYDPDLSQLNFKEKPITRSKYLSKILMSKSVDVENTRWPTHYENGVVHIYVDDMSKPFMSTIINIGDMIDLDRFNKTPYGSPGGT